MMIASTNKLSVKAGTNLQMCIHKLNVSQLPPASCLDEAEHIKIGLSAIDCRHVPVLAAWIMDKSLLFFAISLIVRELLPIKPPDSLSAGFMAVQGLPSAL